MCTIVKNESFNSFELTFSGKPSEKIRAILKANGYRWHGMRRIWYGYKDIAELLNGETVEQTGTATEQPEHPEHPEQPKANATPIKFYYNGIKLNGKNELVKVDYFLRGDNDGNVFISADGYGAQLPRDLFEVENDTDIYTDYFDTDGATLPPSHPLYKFAYYAAKKAEYKRAKKSLKYFAEHPKYRALSQEELYKKMISDFEQMNDPGQPTNADLLKVDEMKKIEFVADSGEWSIVVDGETIHIFDDFSDDLQGDNITAEQIADLVDDLIYSWQQSFENDLDSLDDDFPTVTPIWETDGVELKLVMFTALCKHYNVGQKAYRVVRDLQGGTFGMGRDLTVEGWREQAMEWAYMDDNEDLERELEELQHKEVIGFIAEIWGLEFEEVAEQ